MSPRYSAPSAPSTSALADGIVQTCKFYLAVAAVLGALLAAAWYGLPALLKLPLIATNRATSGQNEKTVSAAQRTVHYLDSGQSSQASGQGVPVLLLHGIFAEKDHWVDFARAMAAANQRLWNAQLKDRYLLDARISQLRSTTIR